ncbi:MAG: hypothetical protein ACRDRS_03450, partial [Pseudonocardiaceae bacterium]
VRVAQVDISGLPAIPELGSEMTVRAAVELAGLRPGDVDVQAIVGRVDDHDELRDTLVVTMRPASTGDGPDGDGPDGDRPDGDRLDGAGTRFEAVVRLPHAGLLGYTVRVLPRHPLMATPAEFGLVHLA